MIVVDIKAGELYDEEAGTFTDSRVEATFQLEHSLVSLSKWESKHMTPFLTEEPKTEEQWMDYLKCMVVDPEYDVDLLERIDQESFDRVEEHINSPQTATTFHDFHKPRRGQRKETITSELVYFWMTQLSIPFDCETWHLNRLFALIQIANIKLGPQKKMSRRETAERHAQLNAQRRAQMGSSG